MAVVALKPRRGYSFTDHAVANPAAPPPGDRLDGEVDRIDRTLAQILDFLATLTPPPAPPAHSLYTAPVGVLGPSSDIHSIPGADPNALAMDWAEVSATWAEHMPDTIPPNILAAMGVTGDHWSSRWWANRAAQIVESIPGGPGGPAHVIISETRPSPASPGDLWWDNVSGQLYVFYSDLTSDQWVPATNQPAPAAVAAPSAPVPANVIAPASGATVALPDTRPVYVNNPAVLAALTLRLPVATLGEGVEISFASPVTSLTLQTSAGAAIPGAPTSAYGPGAAIQLRFETPGWIYWK
jgi:hypothetical protein